MPSNEYILKQLDNDGNIIGYQPDLQYKKERTATGTVISSNEQQSYDPDKDTTLYTKTLNGFNNNTPSSVLSDIDYVLKNINRLKNKLADKFNEEQAMLDNPFYTNIPNQINSNIISNNSGINTNDPFNNINQLVNAGNEGNTNFMQQFEDKYDNIYGSIIPVLLNHLADIGEQLANFKLNFSNLFYGKPNITLEEAKEIDAANIKNMKMQERNGTNGSINYLTVSFDGILNKVVSNCIYQNNKSAIKVAKVIDSREYEQATTNDMDLLTRMFDEVQNELITRSRGYKRNKDIELIQKSLYNYYEKRKDLNALYSLYRKNSDSKFLGRKVTEYSNNLTNAIKNVSRVLLYNQNYLNQITELEKQKYNIQKISRTISSNS